MKMTCSKSGAACVIKIEDRMDAQSSPDFEEESFRLIQEGEKLLVIDLGSLRYISSAGLRSFLVLAQRLKEAGGALRICCLNGIVKQVFTAAGFANIIPVFESVDAAVK